VETNQFFKPLFQGCVVSEHISLKNSVQKQVHVVVKNLAFQIELASAFDLTKVNLTSKLLYDFDRDDDQKLEVSYVKNEPMEYKVNIIEYVFSHNLKINYFHTKLNSLYYFYLECNDDF
jgi:hypothetical protein